MIGIGLILEDYKQMYELIDSCLVIWKMNRWRFYFSWKFITLAAEQGVRCVSDYFIFIQGFSSKVEISNVFFLFSKCQLKMGIAQYKNLATPLST